ncbi:MAG: SUMF1/EgtB/PvdO family nonheme iron enzyme [Bradymonadaceae bacterium]|nr:SUMF1/EgtB/PvdO family nonheme iron enzyme [Lujinxingiaceae bacterium]
MITEQDFQLGQFAVARGLVKLPVLLRCVEHASKSGETLANYLVSQGIVVAHDMAELQERLATLSAIDFEAELDHGDTIVLEELTDSTKIHERSPRNKDEERPKGLAQTWDSEAELYVQTTTGPKPDVNQALETNLSLTREQRYDFVDELGRGGMGQVLRAHDRILNREIAFKTLLPEAQNQPQAGDRLALEAQVTGLLEHPSIIPVYDLGALSNGEPFYTMRVVRERSFEQILNQDLASGEMGYSLIQLVSILRQVCLAIQYAHDQGVIHRDLKPENILVGSYGEVFVIDWGVAKIVNEKLATSSIRASRNTQMGAVIGTPQYMAPEQARGLNDQVDERTDVYALGAVLYEILTRTPVFSAPHVLPLLFKVIDEQPEPPSKRAPTRHVPGVLEDICLKALAKDPAKRFASTQALADDLNLFLEGIKDRERQQEQADLAIGLAKQARNQYQSVRHRYAGLLDALRQERQRVPSWSPSEEKENLWQLEQQADELHIEIERHFGESVRHYGQALGYLPVPEARGALADLYWERFQESEERGERAMAAYFEGLVRQFNDGRYDTLLEGLAHLEIATFLDKANVRLLRFQEEKRRLVERPVDDLGTTPIRRGGITHGSYLLEVMSPGHVPLRAPLLLGRLEQMRLQFHLYSREHCPEDFVLVPLGSFLSGNVQLGGARQTFLPDFAIMQFPVTCGQYIEFLNAIAQYAPQQALQHAPRLRDDADSYFPLTPSGQFILPEEDAEGDAWDPDWPICMVSFDDAQAFARWRSERDARTYRLPTAEEWEKAARGVDGRLYPWGNHFDPSFCKMRESRRGKAIPAPVGSFPIDRSPYGVMDMAGNICEWTSTMDAEAQDVRILKGGSYNSFALMCRLDWYLTSPTIFRHAHYGFRLALDLA